MGPRATALLGLAVLLPLLTGSCGRRDARVDPASGVLRARVGLNLAGRAEGPWTAWYPDGEIRERGSFAGGHRQGLWTRWYPNGQRHSEGERRWHPEPGAALREGRWRFWFSNGQLRSEGHFEQGLRQGPWSCWNHRGQVDREQTGEYRAGQLEVTTSSE